MIDFDAIRTAHPLAGFCESRGLELRRNGPEGQFVCLCPLHAEKTPSFTIYSDGRYYCFGCGGHGDIMDLCAKLDGLSLTEAADKLSGGTYAVSVPAPVAVKPKAVYQLSDADIKRMADAAHRLSGDPALITKLSASRPEWTEEAVRGAALDGDLGYEDGKMLFGYTHGIKARWQNAQGERVIIWLCGAAHGQCWRQSLLGNWHHAVYITEGETDALSVLSTGVEETGGHLVMALAGASMMPKPEPFKGRRVVIIPDPDPAGEKSETTLRHLLKPFARSISTFHLEGLING